MLITIYLDGDFLNKNNIDKYGIDNSNPEIENEETLSPENIEFHYSTEHIKVDRNQFSIYELKRKYDRGKIHRDSSGEYTKKDYRNQIILDSEFQRGEVWDRKQQSELIESVLMGLPLPLMYFYEDKNANLIVVDGRQRLTAFFKYMNNEYKLSDLKILYELSGKKFDELEPILQSKLEDYQLMIQVIKPPTPDTIKFQIFDRVNRGGTPLNNQEMRNALYQGNSTTLLKKLAESEEFLNATGKGISPKRMKDRYVILRSIAFYLLRKDILTTDEGKLVEYKGGLDDLLGKTMEFLNMKDQVFLKRLEYDFLNAMKLTSQVLDENAFRLTKTNKRKSPINMNVFEVWTYLMILLLNRDVDYILIRESYQELINDKNFLDSIASHRDSSKKVDVRYKIVEDIYEELINNDK